MNNSRLILILFVVTSFLTASRTSIMAQGTNRTYAGKVLTVIDALVDRVTYVLRRQHGLWQVVASHASFIVR